MPRLLRADAPQDSSEERQVRRLARSRRAPGDWIRRAGMIVRGWEGLRTTAIARELGGHPQAVRERVLRFNAEGIAGLGDRPGPGRKPRLSEAERGPDHCPGEGPATRRGRPPVRGDARDRGGRGRGALDPRRPGGGGA